MRTLFNSSYHKKNKQSVGETDDFSCFLFVYYMWKHAQKMHKTSNFKIPNWNLTSITHFLMLLIRSTKNYLLYIIFNIIIRPLPAQGSVILTAWIIFHINEIKTVFLWEVISTIIDYIFLFFSSTVQLFVYISLERLNRPPGDHE